MSKIDSMPSMQHVDKEDFAKVLGGKLDSKSNPVFRKFRKSMKNSPTHVSIQVVHVN